MLIKGFKTKKINNKVILIRNLITLFVGSNLHGIRFREGVDLISDLMFHEHK